MQKSTEESSNHTKNILNGFCNPLNALFVSQNSQETNESINALDDEHYNDHFHNHSHDHEHDTLFSDEDNSKKDLNYHNLITADLLKQIESNSPLRNEKQSLPKIAEHSKFFLQQNKEEHFSPLNVNGNYPSFFPKKTNLWKYGNGRLLPPINSSPFSFDNRSQQHNQYAIHNERYVGNMPQAYHQYQHQYQQGVSGVPLATRPYLTPKNQNVFTFSDYSDKGWSCFSCKAINSELRKQCYRCNYTRLIPFISSDQKKNNPIQVPSPKDINTMTNSNSNTITPTMTTNEGTTINLTLREIAQINQMQYNQLKKINQIKELQEKEKDKDREKEKEKKYNTPVLSSNLKDKFESGLGINSNGNANNTPNKKKKKPFAERAGDWVCVKCKNLNFSFRSACNRCHISKSENDQLYEQYMNNLMNYCKVNDILQLKYTSPNTSFPQWISTPNSNNTNTNTNANDQAKEANAESNEVGEAKKPNDNNANDN